jgi:hypothetical protein
MAVADPVYPHITLQLQVLVSESPHLPTTQLMDVDDGRGALLSNEQVARWTGSDGIAQCWGIPKLFMEYVFTWNDTV